MEQRKAKKDICCLKYLQAVYFAHISAVSLRELVKEITPLFECHLVSIKNKSFGGSAILLHIARSSLDRVKTVKSLTLAKITNALLMFWPGQVALLVIIITEFSGTGNNRIKLGHWGGAEKFEALLPCVHVYT